MKAEFIPIIKLNIQPMVCEIVKAMGVEGSELEKCIKKEIDRVVLDEAEHIEKIIAQEFCDVVKGYARRYVLSKYEAKLSYEFSAKLDEFAENILNEKGNI